MKFKLSEIEKKLQFKLKINSFCLGVDTASTTGLAIIETTDKEIDIKTMTFKLPPSTKNEEKDEQYVEKCEYMLNWVRDFKKKIKPKKNSTLVLENSYLGFNAYTFGQLKMMCGILFSELYDNFELIKIIFATTARKEIGFKSQLKRGAKRLEKKKEILDFINNIFETSETSDDIADAIILGIVGIKEN